MLGVASREPEPPNREDEGRAPPDRTPKPKEGERLGSDSDGVGPSGGSAGIADTSLSSPKLGSRERTVWIGGGRVPLWRECVCDRALLLTAESSENMPRREPTRARLTDGRTGSSSEAQSDPHETGESMGGSDVMEARGVRVGDDTPASSAAALTEPELSTRCNSHIGPRRSVHAV